MVFSPTAICFKEHFQLPFIGGSYIVVLFLVLFRILGGEVVCWFVFGGVEVWVV